MSLVSPTKHFALNADQVELTPAVIAFIEQSGDLISRSDYVGLTTMSTAEEDDFEVSEDVDDFMRFCESMVIMLRRDDSQRCLDYMVSDEYDPVLESVLQWSEEVDITEDELVLAEQTFYQFVDEKLLNEEVCPCCGLQRC